MIAAVAGAGLLVNWLLRPTKPHMPWVEASRERARKIEELEERRRRDRELQQTREHELKIRGLTPRAGESTAFLSHPAYPPHSTNPRTTASAEVRVGDRVLLDDSGEAIEGEFDEP
jgi:hypothetical protein